MKIGNILLWGLLIILLAAAGLFIYRSYLAPEPEPTPQAVITPQGGGTDPETVSAEGIVVPRREVALEFVQAGRIAEVLVQEGQAVEAGQVLIQLDRAGLEAALSRAEAALETARANRQAAETQLEQVRSTARQAESAARPDLWNRAFPGEFDQPDWYFTRTEEIAAAQTEVEAARRALEIEKQDLAIVLQRSSSADLLAAETRLSNAQAAFLVADGLLERAQDLEDEDLEAEAQKTYDAALSELEAAQDAHDQALDTQGAERILEARAQVAVAQKRYDSALDRLNELLTGEEALSVRLAQDELAVAEAAEAEAEAAVNTARINLDMSTLKAPFSGQVARLEAEPGQVVAPGVPLVTLADLEMWEVRTTDLIENDVAFLSTGLPALVTLDAFPGREFEGTLEQVALWSEDTRGSVTYEVVVSFDPGRVPVRWGMTAFIEIEVPDQVMGE